SIIRISALAAAALLALGGCSSDSVGPADGPLTGDWTYEVLDVLPPGNSTQCSYTDIGIHLEQRGSQLSGFTAGGFARCSRGEEEFPAVPLQAVSISGVVNGTAVSFLIGDFILNDGTLDGEEISGSARFAADAEGFFTMRRR
ncbi:MAG TPA: hypothetical protein VFR81_09365, partial [Longimicrobium sp.]|nr:hypothetical protein [Longimicrobium sp.]